MSSNHASLLFDDSLKKQNAKALSSNTSSAKKEEI
jgi:hypothetical protein